MTFFNKKEEVLEVKLTPHGRYLLSIGKLDPSYYCFIDDDVVYDSEAIGINESQNDTHQRITEETPKLRSIHNSFGVGSTIGQMESEDVYLESIRRERSEKKINKFPYKLGTNSYSSNRSSTIQVSALDGELSFSSQYYTGSLDATTTPATDTISETINIPQVNIEPKYHIYIEKLEYGEELPVFFEQGELSDLFEDNTYFKILPTIPLLYAKEFNSFMHKENFDIEVYEVDETGKIPIYKPLKFRKQNRTSYIENDMLLETKISSNYDDEEIEETYVDFYFDILVDDEIDESTLCETIPHLDDKNIFIDHEIVCPDKATERFDIYDTRVSPDDLERCD